MSLKCQNMKWLILFQTFVNIIFLNNIFPSWYNWLPFVMHLSSEWKTVRPPYKIISALLYFWFCHNSKLIKWNKTAPVMGWSPVQSVLERVMVSPPWYSHADSFHTINKQIIGLTPLPDGAAIYQTWSWMWWTLLRLLNLLCWEEKPPKGDS